MPVARSATFNPTGAAFRRHVEDVVTDPVGQTLPNP